MRMTVNKFEVNPFVRQWKSTLVTNDFMHGNISFWRNIACVLYDQWSLKFINAIRSAMFALLLSKKTINLSDLSLGWEFLRRQQRQQQHHRKRDEQFFRFSWSLIAERQQLNFLQFIFNFPSKYNMMRCGDLSLSVWACCWAILPIPAISRMSARVFVHSVRARIDR